MKKYKIFSILLIISLFLLALNWKFHWFAALLFSFTGVSWLFLLFIVARYTFIRLKTKRFLKKNNNAEAILQWMNKNIKSTRTSVPPLSISLGIPGISLAILFFYCFPWNSPVLSFLLYLPLSLIFSSFVGVRLIGVADKQKRKTLKIIKSSSEDFCQKAVKMWIEKEHALLQQQLTDDQQPYGYYFDPSLF